MEGGGFAQAGKCFRPGIPDPISPEVEDQSVERGGCAQTGESFRAGMPDVIQLEIKGQGVERGGFTQTGECFRAGIPICLRYLQPLPVEVEGQGVERGGFSQTGECFRASGAVLPNVIRPEVEGQGLERGGFAQTGELFRGGIRDKTLREIEGQGVERGGFAQTGKLCEMCLGFAISSLINTEVEGQGVERLVGRQKTDHPFQVAKVRHVDMRHTDRGISIGSHPFVELLYVHDNLCVAPVVEPLGGPRQASGSASPGKFGYQLK